MRGTRHAIDGNPAPERLCTRDVRGKFKGLHSNAPSTETSFRLRSYRRLDCPRSARFWNMSAILLAMSFSTSTFSADILRRRA
mmetsp:Transcript_19021/g.47332  ORF Transcript_19021/g.47332 Transcript_19021/m.47332 type:complete len:83 (+) Transcript_19021:310-558(+)